MKLSLSKNQSASNAQIIDFVRLRRYNIRRKLTQEGAEWTIELERR